MNRITTFLLLLVFSNQTILGFSKNIIKNITWNNKIEKKEHTLKKKQIKLTKDDFKTLMQIWATMFIFTFPVVIFPGKNDNLYLIRNK